MFLIVDRLWRLFDIVKQINPVAEARRADARAGGFFTQGSELSETSSAYPAACGGLVCRKGFPLGVS
jgi:hypothetical protein